MKDEEFALIVDRALAPHTIARSIWWTLDVLELAWEIVKMRGALRAATKRAERAEDFARECRDNFDCDPDAHRYGTMCRACDAADVLRKAKP